MSNVTLLGIRTNHPGAEPLTPRGGSSKTTDRLRIICGLSVEEFLERFPNRDNVETVAKGIELRKTLTGRVYVLGREAWRCLGFRTGPFFTWQKVGDTIFYLLPHPSGQNLMMNDARIRLRMRRLLMGREK